MQYRDDLEIAAVGKALWMNKRQPPFDWMALAQVCLAE